MYSLSSKVEASIFHNKIHLSQQKIQNGSQQPGLKVYIVVVTLLYEWVVMPGEHTIKQKWTHPRPKHY